MQVPGDDDLPEVGGAPEHERHDQQERGGAPDPQHGALTPEGGAERGQQGEGVLLAGDEPAEGEARDPGAPGGGQEYRT